MSQNTALQSNSIFIGQNFNMVRIDDQLHVTTSFGADQSIGEFEGVTATDPQEFVADADYKFVVNAADLITDSNGNEYAPVLEADFIGTHPVRKPR